MRATLSPSYQHTARAGNRFVDMQDEQLDEGEVFHEQGDLSGYRFVDTQMLEQFLRESFSCKTCTDEMVNDMETMDNAA